MTVACSLESRHIRVGDPDGASGASGQAGAGTRDASTEVNEAGSGGGGGIGAGGRGDAAIDGTSGTGGSSGTAGRGGASGATGSGGTAGGPGSGGAAGSSGGSGSGGTGGTTGGNGGAAGNAGAGGAAGIAGAGGAAGIAGAGGVAGVAGAGGTVVTGGSGGAGTGTGGTSGSGGTAGSGGSGGSGGLDGGTKGGAAGQTGSDAGDARVVDINHYDAVGNVVLFEDHFPTGLGQFTIENGCGMPPDWQNNGGYAHADAPQYLGVNSIVSPTIPIPVNVSNVKFRMHHQVDTDAGTDGAQLLVAVNGAAPTLVTSFTTGGYAGGVDVNPDTCGPGSVPGWSGRFNEFESETDLSLAPFNVGPGDTVAIELRMVVDDGTAAGGWDVQWVRLSGYAQ